MAHVPIDVDFELKKLRNKDTPDLGAIEEGDSEEEEDSSDESQSGGSVDSFHGEKVSDYLQAFTHFTYLFTNKKVMVCDLQGVFNDDMVPPTFELTDPAIHYRSSRREMVFGRTDKGRKGMDLFFHTHKCTPICKSLQLSGKNRRWRKQWHQGAAFTNVNP